MNKTEFIMDVNQETSMRLVTHDLKLIYIIIYSVNDEIRR